MVRHLRALLLIVLVGCSGPSGPSAAPEPLAVPPTPEPALPTPIPPLDPAPPRELDLAPLPVAITVPAGGTRTQHPDVPTGSTIRFPCGSGTASVDVREHASGVPHTPQAVVQGARDVGQMLNHVEITDDAWFFERELGGLVTYEVQRGLFVDERSLVCHGLASDSDRDCVRDACRTLRSTLLAADTSPDASHAPIVAHCERLDFQCEEHRAAHIARHGGVGMLQSECTLSQGRWAEGACPARMRAELLAIGRCVSADGLRETVLYDASSVGGPTAAIREQLCTSLPNRQWIGARASYGRR